MTLVTYNRDNNYLYCIMTFLHFLKRNKKTSIIVFLLVFITFWGAWSMRPKAPAYEFETVASRDIVQQVSVTGRVKPDLDVSLSFETSGKVAKVLSKVGDAVIPGQAIVLLDDADLLANLQQAQARVDTEKARLAQLRAGTRSEEIAVQKVQLANANTALRNAQSNVLTTINDAYTKVDDAVRNKSDKFFINPRSSNVKITFYLNDMNMENVLESGRSDMEIMLSTWKKENDALASSVVDDSAISKVKDHLLQTRTFLNNCALALSYAVPGSSLTQTNIDGYASEISLARTSVNSAISSLESVSNALSSAQSNVELQQSNLALAQAPALPETIDAQVATVEQMQANVRSIQASIAKMILRSPINGIITEQNAKVGQTVAPGTNIVSVISKNELQVEAFIPEADIAKVHLGDVASATLDAYGDTVNFSASVVSIDPAETIIEGVATYKTVFRFTDADERVKPGMTANIDIMTEKKMGVLALPQRVLVRKTNGVFAQILDNETGKPKEVPVLSGLRGSDGYTEIISGLVDKQKVIVPKN